MRLKSHVERCALSGLFTKVLMSNTRSLALVLAHTATVGAVARYARPLAPKNCNQKPPQLTSGSCDRRRSARVLGYAGRSFEYEEAHREISFLLAQGSPLKVGAQCNLGRPVTDL